MAISEKTKERLDDASKEIRTAIDSLGKEVAELTKKVREKFKGTGEEMKETAEDLSREIKELSERVKNLIPKRKEERQLPVRVEKYPEFRPEVWEQPFKELRKATDRLFDEFFRHVRWPIGEWLSPWGLTTDIVGADWPRADMSETDHEIHITAELPGVDKDDLDVSVTEDRITIRGEKKDQEEKKGKNYYQLERTYGSFQRSFSLPCEIDADKVDASFKDGVLKIVLPKTQAARERIKKITVKST